MNAFQLRAQELKSQSQPSPLSPDEPSEFPKPVVETPRSISFTDRAKELQSQRSQENPQEEGFLQYAGRNIAANAARVGETIAGFPGDIQNALESLLLSGAEKITGKPRQGFEEYISKARELDTENPRLAGSRDIREQLTKGLTGESLEPKGEGEKASQEIATDIASLALPGGPMSKLAKFIIPIGAQTAKQISKFFGADESKADLARLGTMMGLTLSSIGNGRQYASNLMNAAESSIAPGTSMSAVPVVDSLKKVTQKDWFKGAKTPSKKPAHDMMEQILGKVENGQMDVKTAIQLRKDINEVSKNLGAFDIVQKADKRAATKYLGEVKDSLMEGLRDFGKSNPEWWKKYQAANKAFALTERSSKLADFIGNNYGRPFLSEGAKLLFYSALHQASSHVPKALAAGAVAATGLGLTKKAVSLTNRIMKSPELRKHYIETIAQASKGNAASMASHLRKLDQGIAKLEKGDQGS